MDKLRHNAGRAILALSFALNPFLNAFAGERVSLFGAQLESNSGKYLYAGLIRPLREQDRMGNGWIQLLWVDYSAYQYLVGATVVDANSYGIRYSVGRQHNRQGRVLGWSAGFSARNRSDNSGLPSTVNQNYFGGFLQVEASGRIGNTDTPGWSYRFIANTTREPDSGYWAGLEFDRHGSAGRHFSGIELTSMGDASYHAVGLAYVTGGWKVRDGEVSTKLGIKQTAGIGNSWFFAISTSSYKSGY